MEVFRINNNQRPVRKDDTLVNEEIRVKEVLVIGADGFQYGVKSIREALYIAQTKQLDLVMVASTATPPVCKLMDYSKFRYEQQRKAKEAKRNQHIVEIKEVRLSAVIDTHDFETKVRNSIKFLEHGDRLKISIRLPYRAGVPLITQGKDVMKKFAESCSAVGEPEKEIVQEGRNLSWGMAPKKK